jgi:phosphoadenosine phosphosulfate reductase
MYTISWDLETVGILLGYCSSLEPVNVEIRPVFYKELDLLGFDQYWSYPRCQELLRPLQRPVS